MQRRTKGMMCIVLAALSFAAMEALARLAGDIPSMQKLFVRSAVVLLVTAPMLVRSRDSLAVGREALPLMALRCCATTLALMCNFYALDRMLLANSSMLQKTAPFFTVLFSFALLGERPHRAHILCIIAACLGCAFIVKPSFAGIRLPELSALACGALSGLAYSCIRKLSGNYSMKHTVIVFYGCLAPALASAVPAFMDYRPMAGGQLACLAAAGLCAALGQFAVTAAYACAPAREISVYEYSQVIFSAMFGFFLYGQRPDGYSLTGYGVIFAASLAMLMYNRRKVTS